MTSKKAKDAMITKWKGILEAVKSHEDIRYHYQFFTSEELCKELKDLGGMDKCRNCDLYDSSKDPITCQWPWEKPSLMKQILVAADNKRFDEAEKHLEVFLKELKAIPCEDL